MIKILSGSVMDVAGVAGMVLSTSKDGIVVGAGEGSYCISTLQPEGRKRMAAHEFLTGNPIPHGHVFS